MKVESVSEEISIPSQNWTPDGGRSSFDDDDDRSVEESEEEKERSSAKEKVKSSAPLVRPTSGSGADGLGADGETGRERRGG